MFRFNPTWVHGSKNYKSSNAVDHAKSDPRQAAMKYHRRDKQKQGEEFCTFPLPKGQQTIYQSIAAMTERDREQLKKKFEIAYFVCKEELPVSKYEKIIQLEEKLHGVDIGFAYATRKYCGIFIDYIGEGLAEELNINLSPANFF